MVKVILYQGHVLNALKRIPDSSVDCIVTSPPYWGLRKYPDSANTVWDGGQNCKHEFDIEENIHPNYRKDLDKTSYKQASNRGCFEIANNPMVKMGFCKKCGAWYGQLGLEPTLDLYLKHLFDVLVELKRVLKPSGVLFWNQGDSYIGSLQGYGVKDPNYKATGFQDPRIHKQYVSHYQKPPLAYYTKIPRKCMAMQNYRLILSVIDDLQKWELRDDLTHEEKEYVIKELVKAGVLT
jgi:hypothetical protein